MDWRKLTRSVMEACKKTFGETITYSPLDGDPVEITAIIDEAYQSVDPATGAIILSQQPMIGVKIVDMPAGSPQPDEQVEMRGANYRVVASETDGQAGLKILLHKAAT